MSSPETCRFSSILKGIKESGPEADGKEKENIHPDVRPDALYLNRTLIVFDNSENGYHQTSSDQSQTKVFGLFTEGIV
jgi:hypothetical protein